MKMWDRPLMKASRINFSPYCSAMTAFKLLSLLNFRTSRRNSSRVSPSRCRVKILVGVFTCRCWRIATTLSYVVILECTQTHYVRHNSPMFLTGQEHFLHTPWWSWWRFDTRDAYYWRHAFGKPKIKFKICCILSHVWCKRSIGWLHVWPRTRNEIQTDLSTFFSIHSVCWLVDVRLTVERVWRSAMFKDNVPYLSQIIATGVLIYSYILKQ